MAFLIIHLLSEVANIIVDSVTEMIANEALKSVADQVVSSISDVTERDIVNLHKHSPVVYLRSLATPLSASTELEIVAMQEHRGSDLVGAALTSDAALASR